MMALIERHQIVFNDPQALAGWRVFFTLWSEKADGFLRVLLGSVAGWSFWIYLCYLKQALIDQMLWLLFPRRFTCRACACLAGRVCLRRNFQYSCSANAGFGKAAMCGFCHPNWPWQAHGLTFH